MKDGYKFSLRTPRNKIHPLAQVDYDLRVLILLIVVVCVIGLGVAFG